MTDRDRRWSPSLATVVAMMLLAACGDPTADVGEAVTQVETPPVSLPDVDLSSPRSVADDPDPSVRAGAVANFVDCEFGLWQGGWTPDFGPMGSGAGPDEAVGDLAHGDVLGLPHAGYVSVGQDGGRVLYVYEVAGSPKAALVVADSAVVEIDTEDRWAIETFASCDPAEFDASADTESYGQVWQDADGRRVPTSLIVTIPGPEHCGWGSITFLAVDHVRYVSDPDDVLDGLGLVAPFDHDGALPSDAIDTGYVQGDRHLWLSNDRRLAYVVSGDVVEVWPTSSNELVCG